MSRIEKFEDIQGWQKARKLTTQIYKATQAPAFSKDYGLADQIRRAAVSSMANIAEGFGRESTQEFIRFLHIANASALEVQSHLYVAKDLGYIEASDFDSCYQQAHSVSRLIGGFINYLKKSR